MQSKKLSASQYFLRLTKDEPLVQTLTEFCQSERIHFGYLTAIGAIVNPTLAYYDLEKKAYLWKEFLDLYEIVSLTGNVAAVNTQPRLHLHLVLSDRNFTTVGGHLKEGRAGGTIEVYLEKFGASVGRKLDEETGLKLLELGWTTS